MNQKTLIVIPIAFTFIFLMAFAIVLATRRSVLLIAAVVASSFVVGTFVVFNPELSRRLITPLVYESRDDSRIFDSFGEQIIAGLFRSPENLVQTIVIGSFMFGFSAAIWGLLFWYADRISEKAGNAAIKNAE